MHYDLLSGDSIRELLLQQPRRADAATDYWVCPVGDYFRQVEGIKKSAGRDSLTASIRSRDTVFHERVDDGKIYMAPLQLCTLQSALFEEDGYNPDPQFDANISRADIAPEATVGMLVLREFDRTFDTAFFDDYRNLMS